MEWSDYGQCFLMNKWLYGTGHILSYIGQYKLLEPIGSQFTWENISIGTWVNFSPNKHQAST